MFQTSEMINHHIAVAAKILKIDPPAVKIVPYFALVQGGAIYGDELTESVPKDQYQVCYYSDSQDCIFLSMNNPFENQKLTEPELLLWALTALRRVWQTKNNKFRYETIPHTKIMYWFDSPEEVDADAFAMAYMEKYTSYKPQDYMRYMMGFMRLDQGKRMKAKKKILAQSTIPNKRF